MNFAKFISLFSCVLLSSLLCALEMPSKSVSPKRIAALERIASECIKNAGGKATLEKVAPNIRKQLQKQFPELKGNGASIITEEESESTAIAKMRKEMDAKFPIYDVKELDAQAEKRYPLYNVGDKVTIVYKANPRSVRQISGTFGGVLPNGSIRLTSGRQIRIGDMRDIVANDGPDGEIAKYDTRYNAELRKEWKDEYHIRTDRERKRYEELYRNTFIEKQSMEDFLLNEANGYTFCNDMWNNLDELIREVVISQLEGVRSGEEKVKVTRLENEEEAILSQYGIFEVYRSWQREACEPSPLDKVIGQEIEKRRQAELESRKAAEELREKARKEEQERQKAENERRQKEAEEQRQAEMGKRYHSSENPGFMGTGFDASTIFIVLVTLVVLGAGGLMWTKHTKRRDNELDVSRFFEGKGQIQKEFWEAAEADPDNFRYVTYLFDNMNLAKSALQKLSYITITPEGKLQCRKKGLLFGTYEHQGRAVAFIGGANLNYAKWREASMRWPELPGAAYFKVSVEPQVRLDLNMVDELIQAGNLDVSSVGQEDRQMENGEIRRVFIYRCSDDEQARIFLEQTKITDDGVLFQVNVDSGAVLYKDVDHIYDGR